MKKLICLTLLIMATMFSYAQELRFGTDKSFKIVQFTDIHYKVGSQGSARSIAMMKKTLDLEKPDLVVFTGDVVVSNPIKQGWDEVLDVVIERKIPFLVTLGNHDDEKEWKRQQVADYVITKPYSLQKEAQISGVKGYLNSVTSILGQKGKPAATIYAMDSQAYSTNSKLKGYGWFDHSQVDWFRKRSEQITKEMKDTLPAFAFFHIPLPEYSIAFNNMGNKRVGVRYEAECSPIINTGMYAAMLEKGDVLGTFVGHDHVNDYLVDYNGVALSYGCFSGSENTYVRNAIGARVIVFQEGQKSFFTYILEEGNQKINEVSYPFKNK